MPTQAQLESVAKTIIGDCYRCERGHPCGHDDPSDTDAAERVWHLIDSFLHTGSGDK